VNLKDQSEADPPSFRVTANFKFGKNRYLIADGVFSVDGVEFRPLDQSRGDAGINVKFELSGSAKEARLQGLAKLERLRAILCCTNNLGMSVEDVEVTPLSYTDSAGMHGFMGGGIKLVSLTAGISLSPDYLRRVMNVLDEADFSRTETDLMFRFLDWYDRALLETNPVNKFIFLWTALEVWKTYLHGQSRNGNHKRLMKDTLLRCGYQGDFENTYELRSDLFHEGNVAALSGFLRPLQDVCSGVAKEVGLHLGFR